MLWQVLFIAVFIAGSKAYLGCNDEKGNPVDWYVVYKIPQNDRSRSPLQDGFSYMFITSKENKGWTISDRKMNSTTSIIAQTIGLMFNDSSHENLWLAYNDQGIAVKGINDDPPPPYPTSFGHTKGVVGADMDGGFWLVHSVPHYPGFVSYAYPGTGRRYGQSAICVTLNPTNLDLVGELLQRNHPDIHITSLSDRLRELYPNLYKATKGLKPSSSNKSIVIKSKDDTSFQAFGKSAKFGKDLYEWVASSLSTNLYAETWLNEPQVLPSSCSISYKVMNIQSIAFKNAPVRFSTHQDHSKWAVSASQAKPWVCVGDINRAVPQEKRGGGTLCISNPSLWNAYKSVIDTASEC